MSSLISLLIRMLSVLPLPALYVIARLVFLLVYRVFAYRKEVVRENLKRAFPGKSDREIKAITWQFYLNFSEYLVETVKLIHADEKSARSMVDFKNTELLDELHSRGKSIVMLQGHFFNWELSLMLGHPGCKYKRYVVYQKLTSKLADNIICKLRARFGTELLAMYQTVACIKSNESAEHKERTPAIYQMGADQSPMRHKIEYWSRFMNQDAAIFLSPERLAKEHNLAVVYLDQQKVGRGKYTITYSLITETPVETDAYYITEAYVRKLEEAINRNPSNWLWSHKRWKNKKITVDA